MKVYTKKQIEQTLDIPYLIQEIEKGLILYSKKKTIMAPVSFLHFDDPIGDVHIKSGAIIGEDYYVIKIASGFYDNPKLSLPSSSGLMLLFSQKTGELKAILLDEGLLTDLRTALAGTIAAKHLANHPIKKIGIIGTGTQAREQLFNLQFVTECREVLIWGRNLDKAKAFAKDLNFSLFKIAIAKEITEITKNCDLIVTATASNKPLIFGDQLKKGTHITAIGADDYEKQELDASVFDKADLIIVDSLSQCSQYGDLAHVKHRLNNPIIELGTFLKKPQIRHDNLITVADLTGIAIEDLQVAKAVFAKLKSFNKGGK